jgi:hypothetical protein
MYNVHVDEQLGSFMGSETGLQPTASDIHSQIKCDAHKKILGRTLMSIVHSALLAKLHVNTHKGREERKPRPNTPHPNSTGAQP